MKTSPPRKTTSAKRSAAHKSKPVRYGGKISPELADLLNAAETRLMMEADNVGMEQLITALTRIQLPRRKVKASKSTVQRRCP